jgi:hypothetical protein
MEDNWKKHLLKSGLPFEYEVKECFVENGCTVWDEYSYLKKDENDVEKEFSYDLDANKWNGGYSIEFMIECKYKTEPTKWFFTPDPYSYQNDLTKNSFFHPIDPFSENSFLFDNVPFDNVIKNPLGPFCLKGVEIFKNQSIETNITKAIKQLSYAFVDKLISSFDSQLNTEMFNNSIFLQIPIIITNADLHLINKNLTTKDIEIASSIEDISTKHDFLLFHNKTGEHLRDYNLNKLADFFSTQEKKKIEERFNTFTKDISHFVDVIASNYSPETILIMNHDESHDNYKKLFDYVNFLTVKSTQRDERIIQVQEDMKQRHTEFEKRLKKNKNAVQ